MVKIHFRNRRITAMRSFCLLIFSFAFISSSAQQQQLDTLRKKFSAYRQNAVGEKIFVHSDRTSYMTGETLWFKIYCVDASFHHAIDLSKVAYVEVLDKTGKAVLQGKVELSNGMGNGSFFIPATLNSENYQLRAYTNWMKNFPEEFFFRQPLTIVNPFRKPETITASSKAIKIDAQFLPEGGNLVKGISSKIAFRVTDNAGRGINFHGALINAQNDTVQKFSPEKFGIGNFTFTPDDSRYRAVIHHNGGTQIFNLPEPTAKGYTIQVNTSAERIDISVNGNVETSLPVIYLFVHTRNEIIQTQMQFLNNGKTNFVVDRNKLQPGISHITVLNENLQPVAERLVYKKPSDLLKISVSTDAQDYSIRRKVKLSLDVADAQQHPQAANLSVSVFRKDSLQIFDHQSINDYLMLTSDLHGEIDSPEFYLKNGTDADFDNLMLTHGWRRFSWEKIIKGENSKQYLAEIQGPTIQGKLFSETGQPAPGIRTYLSSPSKNIRLFTNISGAQGDFRYQLRDLKGARKIILQTNFSKDSLYEFRIENQFVSSEAVNLPNLQMNVSQQNTILSRSIAMQVQDVFNANENIRVAEAPADSTPFYGTADEIYRLDDFTRFPVMEEVMREYVPGVWVRKRQGEFYFMVIDNVNKSLFREDPLILLDGVPIFNADEIMKFDPLKVKKLEVVDRMFFLGRHTFPGVVSYSTYTGDLAGFKPHRRSLILDYDGLQLQRKFYTPTYETERQRSNRTPDQRNLLLWSPDVEVKNGKAEIEFYTSDLSGNFEISIQGLTPAGLSGSGSQTFKVSRYDNP